MPEGDPPSISRRSFLARAGAVAAGALGPGLMGAPAAGSESRPPSFLLILLDDLGYGDLGCYGSEAISTPNMDRLAAGGMRLTHGYSGAPVCTPSRAALMTGRYGVRVGLPTVFPPHSDRGLPRSEKTVAEYLKEAGYSTGIFGKWHLGSQPEYNPTRYGFDRFFGPLHSNDQHPFQLWENERVVERNVDQSTLTRRYTEETARFIRASGRPFFAYLPHTMPHIPLHTEPRFRGVSKAGEYGDAIEAIDHYVGSLVDVLEDEELLENTLILLSSDNGPWFTGSVGGLRGRKGETYEGGMRVPFIAHWPDKVPAGAVSERPACFVDLLPTLCSLAGTRPSGEIKLDGEDISQALCGGEPGEHGPIYFFSGERLHAVRRGRWKLHVRRVPEGGYSPTQQMPQLFDLQRDSSESYDLSGRHPELVDEMQAEIERFESEVSGSSEDSSSQPGLGGWLDWLTG